MFIWQMAHFGGIQQMDELFSGALTTCAGVRPVIVLSSDVEFEDTNGDGVYEIIY